MISNVGLFNLDVCVQLVENVACTVVVGVLLSVECSWYTAVVGVVLGGERGLFTVLSGVQLD